MALLDKNTLNQDFKPALTAMKPWWDNFNEYERLARNKPHPKVIAAKLPTVTDGTLAGVIARQPKRIIQQLPTGRVKVSNMPELAEIGDYVWQNKVIPNADFNGDMLQKSWIMARKALTYGVQASYAFFKNTGDYFGADFSIPYIRDVILERGQSYGPDCNILYLRQWYTESQLQRIIDKEKRLRRSAKRRGDDYNDVWDTKKLRKLINDNKKQKDEDATTPAERNSSSGTSGSSPAFIEIIHAFQTGVGAEFYSFAPDLEDGDNIVRTRINKDPRGKMPINFLYADIDLSSPMGVGYPELSGGMQNLIDSEVQAYQFIQRLMQAPPIKKWGKGIKGSSLKYKSNAVWDMGNDLNNKVEVLDITTHAMENFNNNYGLMKSQVLQLTNNQDSSVPAGATGGVGQSKTDAGVHQQQQMIGFDDNYFRKQFETWFEANAECMMNIEFAEGEGEREIELTPEVIEDLQNFKDNDIVKIDKDKLVATIDYSAIEDKKVRFEVDASTSESDDDSAQIQVIKEILSESGQNPYLYYYMLNDGYEFHMGEAYYDLWSRLGSSNLRKIITRLPRDKDGNIQTPNGVPPAMNPLFDKPSIRIDYKDVEDPSSRAALLTNAGAPPQDPNNLLPTSPGIAETAAARTETLAPAEGQVSIGSAPAAAPAPGPAAPAPQNPAEMGASPAQPPTAGNLRPGDRALAAQFLKAGYSSQQTLYAITLANQGYKHDQVLEAIGAPQGGQTNG